METVLEAQKNAIDCIDDCYDLLVNSSEYSEEFKRDAKILLELIEGIVTSFEINRKTEENAKLLLINLKRQIPFDGYANVYLAIDNVVWSIGRVQTAQAWGRHYARKEKEESIII